MKTLRYLLMVMAVMGVLSVSAQTPKYGKVYTPTQEWAVYSSVQAQMPEATMNSTRSDFMSSGSTLPQAAVTGTSTTFENPSLGHQGNVRKGRPGDWDDPYKDPIGDAMLPLALCALAYLCMRVFLKRKRA